MNQPDFSIYAIFLFGFGVPLLVLPAAFYAHRHWQVQKRLAVAPLFFAIATILFAALIGANYRKPGGVAFACIFGALWLTQSIMLIYVWRKMSRESQRAAAVGRSPPGNVDPFFWQGLLILLPVVMLSLVGLASLKQDKQATEQDARNRAAENAQSLARAVRSSVNDELQRFVMLQNAWTTGLRMASQSPADVAFPDAKFQAEVAGWEREHPGLKLEDLAVPGGQLLADGRRREPADFDVVPTPPKWFQELSSPQRELWETMRSAATGGIDAPKVRPTQQAFFASNPSEDAQLAARYLFEPPEQVLSSLHVLDTESGIPFQDVACYRMLSAANAELSDWLLGAVWRRVAEHPSFVSDQLVELAGKLATRSGPVIRQKFSRMQLFCTGQSRLNEYLESLQRLPDLRPWKSLWWSHWTPDGASLAIFHPITFVDLRTNAAESAPSGPGYELWFVSRAVVATDFSQALNQNKFMVPEYAGVAITIEGTRLPSSVSNTADLSLLAHEEQAAGSLFAQNAIRFSLDFYLTNRALMLSAARARAVRFGLLIAAAAATALFGYFMARRAFYRQLRLNEMKSDFVSSVSHELRAPIASVRLMAEGLEHGRISEPGKQHEYFKFIVQECRRLSSLIENVLDFSRIEQGRKQYEMESTDLAALTEKTVTLMETYAAERQISISLKKTGEPTPVELDGKAMQQALVNLIDNAIKHSPKGSEIIVGLEFLKCGVRNAECGVKDAKGLSEAAAVLLWVEDVGEGIPTAEHEKIFERFYRVGSELRRETQGVGIGLSIVKHIVEAHGGRVTVRSAPGQGSRFTIELSVSSHTQADNKTRN